ncbi:MAG: DUF5722 domain-containing protein [Verrucomicrobiota bacterium]
MLRTLSISLFLLTLAAAAPLKLSRFDGPSPAFEQKDGTITIHGPMSVLGVPETPPTTDDKVIELEYFCVGGVPEFAVLPGPPFVAATSRRLPAMGHSEAWTSFTARLEPAGNALPGDWKQLRLDLPLAADGVLQIRNVSIRPERPGEFAAITTKPAASSDKTALEDYLAKDFPTTFTRVSVSEHQVRIEGNVGKESGPLLIADIPMDVVLNDTRSWQSLTEIAPGEDGSFKLDVPRTRQRNGHDYDRLTSRWQIVRKNGESIEPLSHARYAESVHCRSPKLPAAHPKSKKGLGGWHGGLLPNELEDLGISAVTINLVPAQFISLTPDPGTIPVQWQGRTWHIHEDRFASMDATLIDAQKHDAMVSMILLLANPAKADDPITTTLGHPDAVKDGIFAMPNVTSEEGISLYGAILNFMAERWSRPDGKYGRVHHWIIHNEVDAGWVWTNAGDKPASVYMDLYLRSMRLTDLIARQYDPHARAFISLTHHWAWQGEPRWYGSKRMLDLLIQFCRVEGDFPWALAYHPYPQNLFNPRTWEDNDATFSFDSKKITPKNLEVLDATMKRPEFLHHGKVRPVHLSENGFNSMDYSEKSLEDQVAGMALAWKKMAHLSSIESWQYHNWIDNRGEGGLRIGLRKFPDEPGDPLGKKPIWYLYQALSTAREDAVAELYLKTIGISSWDEVIHKQPIR